MEREYYLDNAATTEVYPDIINTISSVMRNVYGNPSSVHRKGNHAQEIVDKARQTIANYITCKPNEIIFTSGACESNSLAICGYMNDHDAVLITSKIEHKSILSICSNSKYKVEFVDVNETGFVDLEQLEELCKKYYRTCEILVSIQASNSEIGLIQDIKKISKIVHKYKGVFHTDVTQLFPYEKMNVKELNIDMMSMSGQKIHAPKGIGFLYVKKGIKLQPLIYGSQENGLRGGTENVPYIAGLENAIQILDVKLKNKDNVKSELSRVRNYMERQLKKEISNCRINSDSVYCLPNLINISFKDIDAQSLATLLDTEDIYVSVGSACNSGSTDPSDVLKAIKVPNDYIMGTIRITLPDGFSFEETDYVVSRISYYVERLRAFGAK